jgi:hypothetical protein
MITFMIVTLLVYNVLNSMNIGRVKNNFKTAILKLLRGRRKSTN